MPPAPITSRGSLTMAVQDLDKSQPINYDFPLRRISGPLLTDHCLMARFLQAFIDPTCIRNVWHASRTYYESWFSRHDSRSPVKSMPINYDFLFRRVGADTLLTDHRLVL